MPTFLLIVMALLACFFTTEPLIGAEVTVTPSASLGTFYSDNIHFTEKDKIADFRTVFSPAVQLQQRDERGEINITGAMDSYSYANNSELDSVDPKFSANGKYSLSSVLSAKASALYATDYQSDRALTSSGLISTNSKREQNQESLGFDWAFSEKTTMNTTASLGKTKYEDPNYSDFTSQSYRLGIESNFSKFVSELTGLMFLTRSYYDYDTSQSDYTTAEFGFGKNLTEKYRITASVGPSFIKTKYKESNLQETEEWGTTAHCSLDGKFETSTINFSFIYDLEPDSFNSTGAKRTALSSSYLKKMSTDLGLGISASYFRNDSSGMENLSANTSNEDAFNISPRILFQITDDLGVEANYRFSHTENQTPDESRTQNSVFIRLNWSHRINKNDVSHSL